MLGPCWHYFSLLGAFFSLLAGAYALLAFFGVTLVVFFKLGFAAGSILGGLGRVFGSFKTTFVDDVWREQARIAQMLLMQQNHNFCDVL